MLSPNVRFIYRTPLSPQATSSTDTSTLSSSRPPSWLKNIILAARTQGAPRRNQHTFLRRSSENVARARSVQEGGSLSEYRKPPVIFSKNPIRALSFKPCFQQINENIGAPQVVNRDTCTLRGGVRMSVFPTFAMLNHKGYPPRPR